MNIIYTTDNHVVVKSLTIIHDFVYLRKIKVYAHFKKQTKPKEGEEKKLVKYENWGG